MVRGSFAVTDSQEQHSTVFRQPPRVTKPMNIHEALTNWKLNGNFMLIRKLFVFDLQSNLCLVVDERKKEIKHQASGTWLIHVWMIT